MGLLRVALALVVVLAHAGAGAMNPGLAVQAFFIISGFYMGLVLDGKYRGVGLFYSNRLLRLLPSYLVALACAAAALIFFDINSYTERSDFMARTLDPNTGWALIAANLTLVGQDILCWFDITPNNQFVLDPTFASAGDSTPAWMFLLIPQAWSLSLELTFYALAPLFARMRWWMIALIVMASIIVRAIGMDSETSYHLWPRRMFPAELFLFLLGMLGQRVSRFTANLPKAIGWVAVALVLALIFVHKRLDLSAEQGRWLLYAAVAGAMPFAFHAFKSLRVDAAIGDLSYPIYIGHIFVIALVQHFAPPNALWITLAGVLALAILLNLLIERPVDAWRQTRVRRRAL